MTGLVGEPVWMISEQKDEGTMLAKLIRPLLPAA